MSGWLHILGTIFVIAAGTAAGISRAGRLRQRRQLLQDLLQLADMAGAAIRYRQQPLENLWRELHSRQSAFLQLRIPEYVPSADPRGELREALWLRNPGFSLLGIAERQALDEWLRHLGSGGAQEECGCIEALCHPLKSALSAAREEEKRGGRLYTVMGMCAGLATAILLA